MNRSFIVQSLVVGLMLTLTSCAKKDNSGTAQTAGTTTTIIQSAPPVAVGSGPTGGGSGGGCNKTVITQPVYSEVLTGTGNNSVTANMQITTADQLLKIQVEPGSGSTQSYSMMGIDVTLLRNGSAVATSRYPGTVTNGYKDGLNVGSQLIKDFSTYLSSGGTYTVRVSNIMSNYTCMQCTQMYYNACYYYGDATSCTLLGQCWNMQCNVGLVQSGANWSVTIRVETDTTQCL